MKKACLYFLAFVFICFLLPAIMTKQEVAVNSNQEESKDFSNLEEKNNEVVKDENSYDYQNYGNIKLLHHKTGDVEDVEIDKYLYNVVSAEMPVSFDIEALKAQAIVARTYTIYKVQNKKHDNADICDDSTCCQAWVSKDDRFARWEENEQESNWTKIEQCVNDTKGKIITYENKPINAFFHASSGGITELPVNVWGVNNFPYLQVVETAGEEGYSQYASEVELSNEELIEKLKTKYQDIEINFEKDEDIKILEYTDGSRVKTVKFGNYEISGVEARTILGLKSTNFEILKEQGKVKFIVKGYGHGVGMSQTGADALAKQGKNCEEIINHFYAGVEIKEINSL